MTRTSSSSGPRELAASVGSDAREFSGRIRRMVITRTSSARYQVTGHKLLDGDVETRDAEVFQGIGFYARPSDDEDTEAIVAFVGERGANPIVIATRNEATRVSIAGDLEAGETQMHNATVLIRIKRDGTVEIRTAGGVASELATKADVAKIGTAIAGAVIVAADGGASLKATILAGLASSLHGAGGVTPWPLGTTVLKAE